MDTANFTAPFPVRATLRPPTTGTTNGGGGGTYRRLLRALAGPASTAPFYRPQDVSERGQSRERAPERFPPGPAIVGAAASSSFAVTSARRASRRPRIHVSWSGSRT